MLMSLAACGKKIETKDESSTVEITEESIQPTETEIPVEEPETDEFEVGADPVEYSMDFWAEKYPGENICPFYIEIDGTEYSYYHISGLDNGTIISWIESPMNWNNWHLVGNDIVNGDETYKITADWSSENPEQTISSFCTVTTEIYTPEA